MREGGCSKVARRPQEQGGQPLRYRHTHNAHEGIPLQHTPPHTHTHTHTARCVLIGALYKNMASKPNFLCQYTKEIEGEQLDFATEMNFAASADDTLSLEDQSGRVTLDGAIPAAPFATGVIVCVLGTPDEDGTFVVEEWTYPPSLPQRGLPCAVDAAAAEPAYVAFVSGLQFGAADGGPRALQLDAVSSFLRGHMGCEEVVRRIVRLVVAGGILSATPDTAVQEKIKLEFDDYATIDKAGAVPPMRLFDDWVAQVARALPVDVMPGRGDPTNPFIPYQPLHPCLTPLAQAGGNVFHVTSPFEFSANGATFLGTAGENIDDLAQYAPEGTPALQHLRLVLHSGLLAPTAPDTLYCYPYEAEDPMQMKEMPHLLYAGGCAEFATDMELTEEGTGARLLAVPKFSEQPGVTLVNVNSPMLEYGVCSPPPPPPHAHPHTHTHTHTHTRRTIFVPIDVE